MAQAGARWSCPCGTLNHPDWDVCTDCGELRPVVTLDPDGAVRPPLRRKRTHRWLKDPIVATLGVCLCFLSGGLIAFAFNPPASRESVPSSHGDAVAVPASASPSAGPPASYAPSAPGWNPFVAAPPPAPVFGVAAPSTSLPRGAAPVLPGVEFSGQLDGVPPPVGLYAPPNEYPLPVLRAPAPVTPPTAPAPAPGPSAAEQIVARVRGSVLRVEAEAPAADRRGTGFVIGPRLVVTCAHLVQGTSAVAVVLPDGQALRAQIERTDALNDLAVLATAADLPAPLPLDPSGRVEPGEPIAVTGFPSGPENPQGARDWTVPGRMVGWVTRNSPSGERVQMLQVVADIRPGHSGGPVYSLRDGRVLGIMSFRVTGESTSGFATGIPMLQPLLGLLASAPEPGTEADTLNDLRGNGGR